jgi:hypothetical protein
LQSATKNIMGKLNGRVHPADSIGYAYGIHPFAHVSRKFNNALKLDPQDREGSLGRTSLRY